MKVMAKLMKKEEGRIQDVIATSIHSNQDDSEIKEVLHLVLSV